MRRALIGIILGVFFVAAGLAVAWRVGLFGTNERTNVVLVIIDTLRADRLGCYGFPRPVSPELDAMARKGVRFATTVSQSPWTRPATASFLTSLYPRTTGIHLEHEGILADSFLTLAEILRDAGYRTCGATANPHLNPSFNFHQGFDLYRDSIAVFDWMENTHGQLPTFHPALPSAMTMFTAVLEALDNESWQQRRQPHYLQFNVMEVHETWGKNDLVRAEFKPLYRDIPGRERHYLQAVRQISHDLDWFVKELTARQGWRNTLFVVISDHGEGLTSHPNVPDSEFHGLLLYESQVMVPWIMYSTAGDLPAGRVFRQPVRLLEMMPTVLDYLGLRLPDGLDGASLVPIVRNTGSVELPAGFVVETRFRETDKIGVYAGQWKYFENRDEHPGLPARALHPAGILEDGVNTDAGARHPEIMAQLADYLRRWETAHPPTPSTLFGEGLSAQEIEQLRSLGYIH